MKCNQAQKNKKTKTFDDLVHDRPAIASSRPASLIFRATSNERDTGREVKSAIDMPLTFTARLSGRSRLPRHTEHVVADMKSIM